MRLGIPIILGALGLASCKGCGCKATETASPPMTAGEAIPVERDGKPLLVIDRARLAGTPPDYVDADRKAWKLISLLGAGSFDGRTAVEVADAQGARVVLAQPSDLDGSHEVVVTVNRMGELRMALTRADEDIFASFHGRGGNRGRGGEPGRVREVRHVWLVTVDAGD